MKPAKLTGSAAALAVTSMLAVAPLAFAEDAKPSATPNTLRLAAIQAAEEKPAETLDGDQPAAEETPEPIEVVPVPTASPTEAPQPTEEPSPEPSESAEPTPEPEDSETPEPIEVVPVPTASPTEAPQPTEEPSPEPSESAEPTPEPVESETVPAEPTAAPVEPSADPSEPENAPVPVETIAPTPSAPAEVIPVEVDAEQNILLTGTVTQEQTTETGETVVVTEEVTAAGEHVTTEFVVNPAEGQTTVTQTVTNPVTGEKKTTERKVPATTFKAGGAASIEAAPATDRKNTAPLLLGVVGATGVSLAAAGIILYRRQATTAS
ncbi:hypothetical protein [Rothia sp. 11254D007BW]